MDILIMTNILRRARRRPAGVRAALHRAQLAGGEGERVVARDGRLVAAQVAGAPQRLLPPRQPPARAGGGRAPRRDALAAAPARARRWAGGLWPRSPETLQDEGVRPAAAQSLWPSWGGDQWAPRPFKAQGPFKPNSASQNTLTAARWQTGSPSMAPVPLGHVCMAGAGRIGCSSRVNRAAATAQPGSILAAAAPGERQPSRPGAAECRWTMLRCALCATAGAHHGGLHSARLLIWCLAR